jgi:hypothetical protein
MAAAPGFTLLPATAITTAVTGSLSNTITTGDNVDGVIAQVVFTYGSGGTNATAYLQTSLDGGATWIDIYAFQATTASKSAVVNLRSDTVITTAAAPTDGSLTANTAVSGIIGDRFRVKYTTTGTYASTTLAVTLYFVESGRA